MLSKASCSLLAAGWTVIPTSFITDYRLQALTRCSAGILTPIILTDVALIGLAGLGLDGISWYTGRLKHLVVTNITVRLKYYGANNTKRFRDLANSNINILVAFTVAILMIDRPRRESLCGVCQLRRWT
jgi:hypothetical protein